MPHLIGPARFSKKKSYQGFSGIVLEATTHMAYCHGCRKPINFGFVVARYRGTESACQLLFYHKECLRDSVELWIKATSISQRKLSCARCLICGEKKTDWKFVVENHSYSYGGYHAKCVLSFIAEHEARYDSIVQQINEAENKGEGKEELRKIAEMLKVENEEEKRVLNKIW